MDIDARMELNPAEILDACLHLMATFRLLSPLNQTRLYVAFANSGAQVVYPLPGSEDEILA